MKKSIDDLSASDAIALYYEKHHALREGNLQKLLEMKKEYPEIFNEKKDKEIHDMIEAAKIFQTSDRYKELWRQELKEKFTLITNPTKDK